MRLWHWKLIPVLPRQQLLGQWRECCLIARNIATKGSPNHILVNPIMDYPIHDLDIYVKAVGDEMMKRGYNWNFHRYTDWRADLCVYDFVRMDTGHDIQNIFSEWHTNRYLTQCLGNLEEKHDRGGITDLEWHTVLSGINRKTK